MSLARVRNVLIITCCLFARTAHPQCEFDWQPGAGLPGVNGAVRAMTTWDPDGDGPASKVLVLGGSFTIAGSVHANNIAIWDGQNWHALGDGVNGTVNALTVFNSDLVVGGAFTLAGGQAAKSIAFWNGADWHNFGAGFNYSVLALAVYQGNLLAGGTFDRTGTEPIDQLAQWNGTTWNALPGSQFYTPAGGSGAFVAAMAIYQDKLIVGGSFDFYIGDSTNIISWNGSTWSPLAGGDTNGTVRALTIYGDALIAGGGFGVAGSVSAEYVAWWNGSTWSPLATNMEYMWPHSVESLYVHDGRLIAGGSFVFRQYSRYYSGVAQWQGGWYPLVYDGNMPFGVSALSSFNGRLILGGGFQNVTTYNNETLPIRGIVAWTGSSWAWLNDLTIGVPYFKAVGQDLYASGALLVEHNPFKIWLAKWDGSTWVAPPDGFYFNGGVSSIMRLGEELYVGGSFTKAGGVLAKYIARWSSNEWHALAGELPSYVNCLAQFDGRLVAGFNAAFSCDKETWLCSGSVANWTGETWEALGGGVGAIGYNPDVSTMIVLNDRLIVGGWFSSAGGKPANGIAAWDGQSWEALLNGLPLTPESHVVVNDFNLWDGNLVASIGIQDPYPAPSSYIVGLWNGHAWNILGQADGNIGKLAVFDRQLIIGGEFNSVNGVSAAKIARWDNGKWENLGSGLDGSVYSLTSYAGGLLVGGSFSKAGESLSNGFGRWSTGHSPGDADCNDAVDLLDWTYTSSCITGPSAPIGQGCAPHDGDGDQDIDLWDLSNVLGQYFAGRQACVSNAECDDRTYCNGAERCANYSCVAGDSPCDAKYDALVRCSEFLESCLYYSETIDFDNAPDPQSDVAIADQYWNVIFHSEGVLDSPVFKQDIYNNSSYFAFSNSAVFPPGFNMVLEFSWPEAFAIEADVMSKPGVAVTMIAKNANRTVIATTTSEPAPSSFWIGTLLVSTNEPIASIEFWPSDPTAEVGIDNFIWWFPD